MSSFPQESDSYQMPYRRYDADADRLFLVYYALPPGFNRNKWGVSERSIEANIHTALNKPVVVYKKNPNNPLHAKQAGAYIHPTPEEAASELGRINAESYYNWQEKFAIGRVRSVDKREKGYAFTLEITDPEAKNILKSDAYRDGIPGWTSPQIISNSTLYPSEAKSEMYDHWSIAHIALVDIPAYGKEQAGVRAQCLGAEQECMITTRSASQENIGFCVREATIALIESRKSDSSQSSQLNTPSHTKMSESQNTSSSTQTTAASGETVTYSQPQNTFATTPNTTASPVKAESKQEQQQQEEQGKRDRDTPPGEEEKERLALESPQSLQEAQSMIKQMSELLRETQKQLKSQGKELETIRTERKQARLSYIIPRDLFKTDESHLKEVQKTMNENISEQWLTEYWKTKRDLAMAQSTAKRMVTEEPLVAKSASSQNGHDVPDFSSSQNVNHTSNVRKQLELQKMILDGTGGAS